MRLGWPPAVATWGSTAEERSMPFPCERHIADPCAALWRAIDIEAPPGLVFRWLCQLRRAPYSYDWMDNFGRRSPRRLEPGLEDLEEGQRFMSIFELVEFERDAHVTLLSRSALFGTVAVTYLVLPAPDGASRLVVKILVAEPARLVAWLVEAFLAPADLLMMRRQLLNLKALAERDAVPATGYRLRAAS